ncbi:MAG: AAA family ATPase [Opitutaceae bacterium]|nr:AAA family ATPase [Opitutaceae bacterium]
MRVPPFRIALFGPESTGKSQLAESLALHFQEPWSPEYVREFWDRNLGIVTAADLETIARGQIANEEAAAARARRTIFCDTELLTNVLWADLLFPGKCAGWVRETAETRSRTYAIYLLCLTDLPFQPDPQRSFPDEKDRAACMRLWRKTLDDRGLRYVEIAGIGEARFRQACAAVESILNAG